MDAVPLIPKAKVLPNLDAVPLLRELFQEEFQAVVPTKKLSQNILTSVQYQRVDSDEKETFRSVEFLENLTNRKDNVINFTENVLEAYLDHEKRLKEIRDVEKHIFETHSHFLRRKITVLENRAVQDFLRLKRQPLFRPLNVDYVKKYRLLQGEAGLPLEHLINTDFRVKNFKKWKKKLGASSQEDLVPDYLKKTAVAVADCRRVLPLKNVLPLEEKKIRKPRPKNKRVAEKPPEIFKAQPKIVCFTDYKIGDVYQAEVNVKNMHTKGVQFQLKPTCPDGPFKVVLNEKFTTKVFSGLSFTLNVEFTPKSLENVAEDVLIVTEDGNRLLIPLIAYLEPPILKTHKEVNEYTKVLAEKIGSSYIECGSCFTGDNKVTKLRFRCYQGSGEFFVMSSDNWSMSYVNTVTFDNLLDIPPFQVYPAYFKMEKDEVIDFYVEFKPKNSGMHVENIVIACDNGEIRFLNLIGDGIGWHSYYFTFQDFLLKTLPVEKDDDVKVKYYLDFGDCTPSEKVEKVFCVCNNSNMAFEFQWKIREANIQSQEKYLKLSKFEVKIDPENGTIEGNSIWEFVVTITFNNAEIGNYRMVLSLFVLNLPYQCIEEDNTIIQPTGLVRNLYSQSLYGEEEGPIGSPELASLQGTYESLQESIKSYVECQTKAQTTMKNDFCRTVCIPNPGLCAKPLKKSKTFFNIGDNLEDEGLSCGCRLRTVEPESNSDSCTTNTRDEKTNESSVPRNEIIWDFVDVLVDEIELWVEVVPTRVSLEPAVLEFDTPLKVNDLPVFKKVRIVNHNRSPVTCKWTKPSEIDPICQKDDEMSLSLLFDKNFEKKGKVKSDTKTSNNILKHMGGGDATEEQETENFNEECEPEHKKHSMETPESFRFTFKPQKSFLLGGCAARECEIGISGSKPGKFKETLYLSVNDEELELNLLIMGSVESDKFETSPDILNFGVLKQGTRYTKEFKITNQGEDPLFWRINTYNINFIDDKFPVLSEVTDSYSPKRTEGIVLSKEINESYVLNAKDSGIKCLLLEVDGKTKEISNSMKKYIFVLGDVKEPQLWLSSPRFENAILSPSGTLYVGQTVHTKVTLTNTGPVETFFTWGQSFGCHSRKIKVDINPKSCRIDKKNKLTISIDLTALEEGIINHCYIPCFFCRSSEPLILSIVALADNVNVTFEIIDYPMQTHADPNTFLKSPFYHTVLRVPWPLKIYKPTLNRKYLNENDVINMNCQCLEVDEEARRAFGERKHETVHEVAASEKSVQSLLSFDIIDENILKSKTSMRKNSKLSQEDLKMSNSVRSGYAESKKSDDNFQSVSIFTDPSSETLRFIKSELEFLNVPFRTPMMRQFVIRNETPIQTCFQINVLNYGVATNLPYRRVDMIKNKVMGHTQDEFQNKLKPNQPLVLEVTPSKGELNGFDALCINVYCYGNTWGEYRDCLICQINGTEPFHLKTTIQIVGHPIYFPMFKTQTTLKPVLWFQPLTHVENPATKQIKVSNRSAIPVNITWTVFLTKPLPEEEETPEEGFNYCAESNPSVDDSSQSSKNYIPKNTSDSVLTFRNPFELSDSSQNSCGKSLDKTISSPEKKRTSDNSDRMISMTFINDEVKSNYLPGRPDTQIFQIEPKKLDFEPFEEKKITVTFNPSFANRESLSQEFKAVLTGCVKLKPEDEKCPELYYRPCGINFVSELMDFNALVETPLAAFEILKGDLKFIVDSNAVAKSPSKQIVISRKFLIRNKNQNSMSIKIELVPGELFKVLNVNTIDKYYPEYNPDKHNLRIEPGHLLEMELECSVTYKDVIYAFVQLKLNRNKNKCPESSHDLETLKKISSESNKDSKSIKEQEPWKQYFNNFCPNKARTEEVSLSHKDSYEINLNRRSLKSNGSECFDFVEGGHCHSECEGEYLELPKIEEIPCVLKPYQHEIVIEEDISFVQSGLVTQTLVAKLHLSFPVIKISPPTLDFGNVYLGETAVRYCSLINLTGFATDFRVKAKCNVSEFTVNPLSGNIPSTNYNSDIGVTLTVKFRPPKPGYFKEIFFVYCNSNWEFDFFELFVSGFGTWNEKYKTPKLEIYTKLPGIYPNLQK